MVHVEMIGAEMGHVQVWESVIVVIADTDPLAVPAVGDSRSERNFAETPIGMVPEQMGGMNRILLLIRQHRAVHNEKILPAVAVIV